MRGVCREAPAPAPQKGEGEASAGDPEKKPPETARPKAEGEATDLNHAMPFAHATRIWAGDFSDCAGAAITVLTAGSNQKPGETRLDMVSRNAEIWRQIIPRIVEHNPHGILLIATNPVDILTRLQAVPGLTVAVIILVIVATVTLSLLLRRPGHVGNGVSTREVPARGAVRIA